MSEDTSPEPVDAEIVEEPVPPPAPRPSGYTDAGVPTFDHVRDRIENRHTTSTGATELAEESRRGRDLDQQLAERERAGRDRLEEIRRSMRGE